jgi:hypothetical protein
MEKDGHGYGDDRRTGLSGAEHREALGNTAQTPLQTKVK